MRSQSPEALARIQASVAAAKARASTVAQLDAARSLADWACYGSSFILTGNLFAPFVASTAVDLLFSGYQRKGAARLFARDRARFDAANRMLQRKMDAAAGQDAGAGGDAAAALPPTQAPPPPPRDAEEARSDDSAGADKPGANE